MMASDDTSLMQNSSLAAFKFLVLLAVVFVGPLTALPGCDESWNRSRDTAILALERGDNRTALEESRRLVNSGPRSMQAEAAYLGGMAAFRRGDHAEAIRLLDIAVTSSDQTLRGQALIERGTVERAIGRNREAADDLERGGSNLGGDIGQSALLRAAEIYKELRLEADARRCLDQADRLGPSRGEERTMIAGYTIQFGAFRAKSNAESCVRELDAPVRAARLGVVMITQQDGLHKVQLGCYRDIRSAKRDLDRIRIPAGIMATIVEIGS
jgi:tetratricopeptide (TPR) repeat protein